MRLLVQTENAGVAAIDVMDSYDLSVRHLKQTLEAAGFKDAIFQTVFLGTAPLADAALLHDYDISDGDVLRLGIVPLLSSHSVSISKPDTQGEVFEASMCNLAGCSSLGCPVLTAPTSGAEANTNGLPERREELLDPLRDDPISQFPPNISQTDPIDFTAPSPRTIRLRSKKQQAKRR